MKSAVWSKHSRSKPAFKILILTYTTLHGMAPAHLTDLLTDYTPPQHMCSVDQPPTTSKLVTGGESTFQR